MKNNYHYLPIRAKELWWRYGLFYLPWAILLLASDKSILEFTFWFLLIGMLASYLEYKRCYFLIQDDVLIKNTTLAAKKGIPIKNIKRIVKGSFGITHAESLICYYSENDIERKFAVTLFSRDPNEILRFLKDISSMKQYVFVDPKLKQWSEAKIVNYGKFTI